MQADRVSIECVDQLAQRNSDYHADRVSVECVDQLAQRNSDYHADRVSSSKFASVLSAAPTATETVSP